MTEPAFESPQDLTGRVPAYRFQTYRYIAPTSIESVLADLDYTEACDRIIGECVDAMGLDPIRCVAGDPISEPILQIDYGSDAWLASLSLPELRQHLEKVRTAVYDRERGR